jgi:hypothetical protein
MDVLIKEYAVVIFVVVAFLFKNKLVVSPAQLADKLSDLKEIILLKVKEDYASKDLVNSIKEDTTEIKQQLLRFQEYFFQHHE